MPPSSAAESKEAEMENDEKNVSVAQLNGLIKQKRNAELKSILLKDVSSLLIDKRGSTLMHTAVMFNNIDSIALLFSFGFNINAQNSIGQTPLLVAAQDKSYQAVQLLLALDADVLVADNNGKNVVEVLLQEGSSIPAHLFGILFERLKRSELSPDDIANELVKASCPLEYVLMLNDAEVTREVLVRTEEIDEEESRALMKRAMYTMDMANARVLLECKRGLVARRRVFIEEVTRDILDPTTLPFFKQLVNWDVVDEPFLDYAENLFKHLDAEGDEKKVDKYFYDVVQLFLDVGIDEYCRKEFGCELLVNLFYNTQINVIKLLRKSQFDVNGRDKDGNSALHVAIKYWSFEGIVYLLNNGADPNIEDCDGQTPLFYTEGDEVLELLLEAGADLQVKSRRCGYCFNEVFSHSYDLALAHLMILEFQGLLDVDARRWLASMSEEYLSDEHSSDEQLQNSFYYDYIRDLRWMKSRRVSESINLFTVLTEKFQRLACYVRDEKTYAGILNAIKERPIIREYAAMLEKKLKKAREMNKLKLKAATFLCSKMQIFDCDHLVIRMIIEFLTYYDLQVFNEMEEVEDVDT